MNSNIEKIQYHFWANEKMLDYLKNIDESYFQQQVKNVFPSIKAVFEHIYAVDSLWLSRIMQEEVSSFPLIEFSHIHTAIEHFQQLYQTFSVQNIENRVVHYRNTKGETFENSLDEIVIHLMNHGTYHRGNVTSILHQLGQKGISTDFIYFLRENK